MYPTIHIANALVQERIRHHRPENRRHQRED